MMDIELLKLTAKAMVAGGKGLLAIDESIETCNERFAKLGILETAELRCAYREMIVTTPKLNESISGVILFDETIHQHLQNGTPFIKAILKQGILPGIKVDIGAENLAGHEGEKITEGLDGLRGRLAKFAEMGLQFAKWRAVIAIGHEIPSQACIESNANELARYAALCQEAGLVPIVEPEVLMKGNHTLKQTFKVTEDILLTLFRHLHQQNVMLEGLILKINMVISGADCAEQASVNEVAEATIKCLLSSVPVNIAGIVFLSGGQSGILACKHLNAMHVNYESSLPWPLTFSFGRAIQQPAIDIWKGKSANIVNAQRAIYHRARCSSLAVAGKYEANLDKAIKMII